MSKEERKQAFIELLAHFLADDQASKSIMLQTEAELVKLYPDKMANKPLMAHHWAKLYGASGLNGWVCYEDARQHLMKFLEVNGASDNTLPVESVDIQDGKA